MARKAQDPAKVAERAAKKEAAKARKERKAQEERQRRQQQLEDARSAVKRLAEARDAAEARATNHAALLSHLNGFYDEIDKLAKGKALVQCTDLVVEQINDIIRDAKQIISDDQHLGRVKEFVPAGDNPVYPDVLIVTRAVQQCLNRTKDDVQSEKKKAFWACREMRTIAGALEAFLETGEYPGPGDVQDYMTGVPTESWFFPGEDGQKWFDFERLDRQGIASGEAPPQ
ncbi:MAG TPA: hypothetical protein VN700_06525 [Vicinamibacterales bacterium]|nr:hypothetical protein [Vicinamibacterales bacterium]